MSLFSEFKRLSDKELTQRITDMVSNQEDENQELDFKSIDSLNFLLKDYQPRQRKDKKSEFAKDLSAFVNATGGVIIYGIEETYDPYTGQRSIKSFGRGIDKTHFSREQLIQIANSAVVPTITGLDVKVIEHPNDSDTLIIILLIPETTNGAIMSQAEGEHCFRYFQRQVTENKPMLNWQVRLVNSKVINPQIVLNFDTVEGLYFVLYKNYESALSIKFPKLKNIGRVTANQVGFVISIPKKLSHTSNIHYFNELINIKETKTSVEKMKVFNHPIFPGLEINTFPDQFEFTINFKKGNLFGLKSLSGKDHSIDFIVYSDNAEPKIYKINIDLTNISTPEELVKRDLSFKEEELPYKIYLPELSDIVTIENQDYRIL